MRVRISTKNWLGHYNSREVLFNDQRHLDNYLAKCDRDHSTSKVIGHEILK